MSRKNKFICEVILSLLISTLGIFWASSAKAVDLSAYLQEVQSKNKNFQSYELTKETAEDRRLSGDISLVPTFQLKSQYLRDEKQPNFYGATAAISQVYSLGVNQKLSTGTAFSATASAGSFENKDISGTFAATLGKYGAGSLNLSLSQSLWKDAFGRGTRLRQKRETLSSLAEKAGAEIQMRVLLVDAEKAFWDYIYLKEEQKLWQASLARAQRIESWVTRRVGDGIGDRADLLNAKALQASRRLQLQTATDNLRAAEQKIRDILEISNGGSFPNLEGSIEKARQAKTYLNNSSGTIISLDAYAKSLQAEARLVAADEVQDSQRSDIVLSGSYASNSYRANEDVSYAANNVGDFSKPTTSVALTWTYLLDTDVKRSQMQVARKEAASSRLQSEKARSESISAWSEYLRRYDELTQKITTAQEISQLQMDRAKAEQDKLSKGRSITQNVITAEQEAAEAELRMNQLKVEQRKLEAQSRLFISVEEKL